MFGHFLMQKSGHSVLAGMKNDQPDTENKAVQTENDHPDDDKGEESEEENGVSGTGFQAENDNFGNDQPGKKDKAVQVKL